MKYKNRLIVPTLVSTGLLASTIVVNAEEVEQDEQYSQQNIAEYSNADQTSETDLDFIDSDEAEDTEETDEESPEDSDEEEEDSDEELEESEDDSEEEASDEAEEDANITDEEENDAETDEENEELNDSEEEVTAEETQDEESDTEEAVSVEDDEADTAAEDTDNTAEEDTESEENIVDGEEDQEVPEEETAPEENSEEDITEESEESVEDADSEENDSDEEITDDSEELEEDSDAVESIIDEEDSEAPSEEAPSEDDSEEEITEASDEQEAADSEEETEESNEVEAEEAVASEEESETAEPGAEEIETEEDTYKYDSESLEQELENLSEEDRAAFLEENADDIEADEEMLNELSEVVAEDYGIDLAANEVYSADSSTFSTMSMSQAITDINDYIAANDFDVAEIQYDIIDHLPQYEFYSDYGWNPENGEVGQPSGVVLHDVGNDNSTIHGEISYMSENWENAFVHAFVDADNIIQIANTDYLAYGAGEYSNQEHLHVELVRHDNQHDFAKSINNYADYIANLLYKYKLPAVSAEGTGEGTLWSHVEVSHSMGGTASPDPYEYFQSHGYEYNDVISLIDQRYNALYNKEEAPNIYMPTFEGDTENLSGEITNQNRGLYESITDVRTYDASNFLGQDLHVVRSEIYNYEEYYLLADADGTEIGWMYAGDVMTSALDVEPEEETDTPEPEAPDEDDNETPEPETPEEEDTPDETPEPEPEDNDSDNEGSEDADQSPGEDNTDNDQGSDDSVNENDTEDNQETDLGSDNDEPSENEGTDQSSDNESDAPSEDNGSDEEETDNDSNETPGQNGTDNSQETGSESDDGNPSSDESSDDSVEQDDTGSEDASNESSDSNEAEGSSEDDSDEPTDENTESDDEEVREESTDSEEAGEDDSPGGATADNEDGEVYSSLEDPETGIRVYSESDELDGKSLVVTVLGSSDAIGADHDLYDIHLLDENGSLYNLNNPVTVYLPAGGYVSNVYYLGDIGETLEAVDFRTEDGYAVFEASDFSQYAVVYGTEDADNTTVAPVSENKDHSAGEKSTDRANEHPAVYTEDADDSEDAAAAVSDSGGGSAQASESEVLPDTGVAEQSTTIFATILAAIGLGFLVKRRKTTEK